MLFRFVNLFIVSSPMVPESGAFSEEEPNGGTVLSAQKKQNTCHYLGSV